MTEMLIVNRLCVNNFPTYIVGGHVRDMFLDRESHDIDIATLATPDQIIELFKDCKIKTVGKSFNVVLVDDIEVATFRSEICNGLSDKNIKVEYAKSIVDDLSRRDLTINSIAYCIITGEIIDPFNGQNDIKNKIIRFTGDPERRIMEDPNRIIRACRFKALIDGEFDPDTKEALVKYAHLLMEFVDKDRIKLEIVKCLSSVKRSSLFFNALREIDALQYIFPSLDLTYDYNVKEDHGKYHGESILEHSLMCGDNLSTRKPLLKLAGYLHDVGKPLTCKLVDDNMCFRKHEDVGECYSEIDLRKNGFSNKEVSYISSLVGLHMRSFKTPKAVRKTLVKLDSLNINWKDLFQLKMADSEANLRNTSGYKKETVKEVCLRIFSELYVKQHRVNQFADLNIDGKEIMEILDIPPGNTVGQIKNWLFELVLDDPSLNDNVQLRKIVKSGRRI